MNKPVLIAFLLTALCCVTAFSFFSGKGRLQEIMDNALEQAVETDLQRRLCEEKLVSMGSPMNRKIKEIKVTSGQGTELFILEDSMEQYLADKLANQYILSTIHPIQPEKLNRLVQEELRKQDILCPTAVGYRRGRGERKESPAEFSVFDVVLTSEADSLDIKGEMSVQLKAGCPLPLIAGQSPAYLRWGMGLLLTVTVLTAFLFPRHTSYRISPCEPPHDNRLVLKRDNFCFCIAGQQRDLTEMQFYLLEALCRHSHQTVTRQEIASLLWQKEQTDDVSIYNNRIDSHIASLRKLLVDFPDYRIETVKRFGYRLTGPGIAVEG
ncbi:MAG: helix-turn-helix domain-containing protein [Phocaeicola plebeius]|nr:helix-turn-helix domain-containing protein [Phocaeicola plebeius]